MVFSMLAIFIVLLKTLNTLLFKFKKMSNSVTFITHNPKAKVGGKSVHNIK